MPESLRHKRWERTGRTFEVLDDLGQPVPNKFALTTRIGEKNVDAGDGTFAPYLLNGAVLRHGDAECEFADGWQVIRRLGQVLVSRSRLFIQRETGPGVWADVPHGIPTRNIVHDYPNEGKCTAYLDFPDIQGYAQGARLQIGVEVGGGDRQTYGFRMRSPVVGRFRLEWVLEIPEDVDLSWIEVPTSRTDPTPIRIGGRIGQTEIKWSATEAPFRSATVEPDGAGGRILHVFLGPYDLQPLEWLTIYPDTWGPTNIAAGADDGHNSNGTWSAEGGGSYEDYCSESGYNETPGWSWAMPGLLSTYTISEMYFRAYCSDASGTLAFTLQTEDVDPASQVIWSQTHLPSPSSTFINSQTTQNRAFSTSAWYFGKADTHPLNLAADLQDLLTAYGDIASGQRINIAIPYRGSSGNYAAFEDYSHASPHYAQLTIVYTAPAAGSIVPILMYSYRARRN